MKTKQHREQIHIFFHKVDTVVQSKNHKPFLPNQKHQKKKDC